MNCDGAPAKRPAATKKGGPPAKKAARKCNWPLFRPTVSQTALYARCQRLSAQEIHPTRFYCHSCLRLLGINYELRTVFNRAGLAVFYRATPYTYVEPTIEFFSTFSQNSQDRTVSFQLHGDPCTLSYEELASCCGLLETTGVTPSGPYPSSFCAKGFWEAITDGHEYNSQCLQASWIINPCLRFIHRLFSCAFFAKEEIGAVSPPELFLLWALTVGHRQVFIDWGAWLATQFHKAANSKGRNIHIGGLVTLLASSLGFEWDCKSCTVVDGYIKLEAKLVEEMHMFRRIPDCENHVEWLVGFPPRVYLTLPNKAQTTLKVKANYLFSNPDKAERSESEHKSGVDEEHYDEDFVPLQTERSESKHEIGDNEEHYDEDFVPLQTEPSHLQQGEHQITSPRLDLHSLSSRLDEVSDTQIMVMGMLNALTDFHAQQHPSFIDPRPALQKSIEQRQSKRRLRCPPPPPSIPGSTDFDDLSGTAGPSA